MNFLVKAEYAVIFLLSIALFAPLPFAWWWYPLLILVPDIGMAGYLLNPRIGALTYNATHWLPLAVLVYVGGALLGYSFVTLLGVVMIGHIGLDRMFGYGLKYADSFRHTHLGRI